MKTDFVLPAEWYPQDAILVTWPHEQSAWHSALSEVEQTYFELTSKLSHYQPIIIQLHASIDISPLLKILADGEANLSNCHFIRMDSNDTWARDHGPIGVLGENGITMLDFTFNGWGNKFESQLDNLLNLKMAKQNCIFGHQAVDWVLEGGSVESDGQGTIMTTENCVLNENRNGPASRADLEALFKDYFGAQHTIWLANGELEGDDTDAHIDTLARFAPTNTIVFQGCQDTADSHFPALNAMKQELALAKNANGESYRLIELPFPKAIFADDGHRLPATYANFLVTNKLVLVPVYGDSVDNEAMKLIAEAFPDHMVTSINARPLIEEHGSLHCITMQLPKGSVNFNAPFEQLKHTG
ncbi:agmatine/peptidylarginine deiminase [Reinekea sp. G2M2-21]|uniref:agmatine deiminase family protein n=1 Tax=Reinekea sp. G2M2-21 TaxID=2788942 RepID=UPI0018A8C42B|nr:agmatine deiminase family protein [Reinekea sp. G2M2-21]